MLHKKVFKQEIILGTFRPHLPFSRFRGFIDMEASAKSETRTAALTLATEEMAGKTKELTVELHMAVFSVAIA